jgi:predicted nucleic acid-binding protein
MGIEPFTAETAEHHADIFAELTQSRTMIPQNDIAVAATARCLGCGVLVGPRDEAISAESRASKSGF